ncbi:DUF309 domain-containing protein [Siminovitchia sediminis]|uniref:DUF309 domain-containing protein n=1 Tax=Siminovitchia sediminis TaxID=1274353 RepID=A0ABW4KIB9_9BACI
MIFPLPYIEFLTHFHGDRDFFECHEILEEHWKRSGTEKGSVWVGLIQVAVGFYHYRRGNKKGAYKMMDKAYNIFIQRKAEVHSLGLDHRELIIMIQQSYMEIQADLPYQAKDLPIIDLELLTVCKERVRSCGWIWGNKDDFHEEIIHKHVLRKKIPSISQDSTIIKPG